MALARKDRLPRPRRVTGGNAHRQGRDCRAAAVRARAAHDICGRPAGAEHARRHRRRACFSRRDSLLPILHCFRCRVFFIFVFVFFFGPYRSSIARRTTPGREQTCAFCSCFRFRFEHARLCSCVCPCSVNVRFVVYSVLFGRRARSTRISPCFSARTCSPARKCRRPRATASPPSSSIRSARPRGASCGCPTASPRTARRVATSTAASSEGRRAARSSTSQT